MIIVVFFTKINCKLYGTYFEKEFYQTKQSGRGIGRNFGPDAGNGGFVGNGKYGRG
jgi:hypothetical protein